jgi:hypothetical protein
MAAQTHDCIDGLIMAGEHSGVPLALPAVAFTPEQPR